LQYHLADKSKFFENRGWILQEDGFFKVVQFVDECQVCLLVAERIRKPVLLHHLFFCTAVDAQIDLKFVQEKTLFANWKTLQDGIVQVIHQDGDLLVLLVESGVPESRKIFATDKFSPHWFAPTIRQRV
jgi:hypothetical protein